jgi:phthalate 4,5-dioxygenase oxygenase subunit
VWVLTVEDNATVARVGPGTVMGNFMREYWLPAMLSSEIPKRDCDPVRVRMLGEDLIGFRDHSGKAGLVQNLCPHRGASLFFGRNEEDGLRCVYHGWKFDVEGNCVDMPNEPPESNFKARVKATAYPVQERAGLVWVYMGTRDQPPALPDIEATIWPAGASVQVWMAPCNWLQVLEGNIDTVHSVFLHGGANEVEWYPEGSFSYYNLRQRWARFAAADTDYGAIYGAYRPGPPGHDYWRIGQFFFPCWSSAGTGVMGYKIRQTAWVPMDDTHTLVIQLSGITDDDELPTSAVTVDHDPDVEVLPNTLPGILLPNTTDWYGRFNTKFNWENDFLLDREMQREFGSFCGMELGVVNEDTAIQISMGPVLPREIEHLGTSDMMIIRARQRLLDAARAFDQHKVAPPALDTPEVYNTRSGGIFIPEDADWLEYIKPWTEPGLDRGKPDPNLEAGAGFKTLGFRHKREGAMF